MSEDWGPWVDDNPLEGQYIQVRAQIERGGVVVFEGTVVDVEEDDEYYMFDLDPKPCVGSSWHYIKHRVRKPNGLIILGEILREVEREPEVV